MMMGLLSVLLLAAMQAQAPPPQRPAELDTLQIFVGAWNATIGSEPRANADGVTTYRWDAGRRWLMSQSSFTSVPGLGPYEVHAVVGFDAETKRYRAWAFNSVGIVIEYTGRWETDRQAGVHVAQRRRARDLRVRSGRPHHVYVRTEIRGRNIHDVLFRHLHASIGR